MMLGPMLMAGGTAPVVQANAAVGDWLVVILKWLVPLGELVAGVTVATLVAWWLVGKSAHRQAERFVSSLAGGVDRAETEPGPGRVCVVDDGWGGAVAMCMLCGTGRHYTSWESAWADEVGHRCSCEVQEWPSDANSVK